MHDELTGNLKRAADEVRAQQPPDGSAERSVERAARLGEKQARRREWVRVAAGAIAAAYFVALGLWTFREPIKEGTDAPADAVALADVNDDGMMGVDASVYKGTGTPGAPRRPAMLPPLPPPPEAIDALRRREYEYEKADPPVIRLLTPSRPNIQGQETNGTVVPGLPRPVAGEGLPDLGATIVQGNDRDEPRKNSSRGDGSGPGEVDKRKKLKEVAEAWSRLPEKEREKSVEELVRDLPPAHRKVIEDYFKKLGDVGGEKKPDKAPQVWKPRARPTFARVHLGDGNSLELVSLHVTVTVEGPRARTLVDHVFRNPHDRQLEGTFEYPLPTGASPSYFAMFLGQTRGTMPPLFAGRGDAPPLPQEALARLTPDQLVKQVSAADWGKLQEARVVSKDKALETYEEVTRRRIDPALLEYAGGNTFSGRVFPIPPKGYNRVLIAYEEQLPIVGDQVRYRFPLPDCQLSEMQFTLSAGGAECKDATFQPKEAKREEGGGRVSFSHTWRGEVKGGDAVFAFTPPRPDVQAISGRHGESGPLYLYARVRPDLKIEKAKPFAKHAVFLLDTSLSEHPGRFDMNMKLLRAILEADADIESFNVLTFNVGAAWVEPNGWINNTAAGRDTVFKRLDGLVLEGATDFGAALDQLAAGKVQPPAVKGGATADVFVLSDGQITWGESDATTLAVGFDARCPYRTRFHCYRTALGAENLELYGALTRKGGGVYNCFTEKDVAAAARAHRRQCLQVESVKLVGLGAADVLVAGRQAAVYPGGDLIVAARLKETGKAQLVVEGTFNGEKFAQEYPIEAKGGGELAPRGWGEIAVASLLALSDPKLEALATAYCQEFGIGSRAASFLILENENEYKRFNLEEERGKTLAGDLAKYLDAAWAAFGKPVSARERFMRFLSQVDRRTTVMSGGNGQHVAKLLGLLKDADFELPASPIAGALVRKGDVPPEYLAGREADRGDVAAYLAEARRRAGDGDADGAVRVLSSVIEEHPGRGDALRLVGYRLLDLKQPAQAARLFDRVQRQRPFEPHSYRDLARSLEDAGKYGLAAVQYEVVLAGTWHQRFRDSIKQVVREEYAAMMREAIRKNAVNKEVADLFGERLEKLVGDTKTSDLRVTISWNTDDTDVDLWVIEPDGEKCFYQHKQTKGGGELSDDMTQGYGPERYRITALAKGRYRVMVHYYRANPNLLAGETNVNVVVTRHAGTPQETTERHTVILKKQGEAVEVCRVEN
ncbi:MAG TPA: VIT domain-containing protein [Gemmataceae bacterium]|nr:VIT domain-containing protein [Gemmataceae bacterium]